MRVLYFFTHKQEELENNIAGDPPGFNVNDAACKRIDLPGDDIKVVYIFLQDNEWGNGKINTYLDSSDEKVIFFHNQDCDEEDIRKQVGSLPVVKFTSIDNPELWDTITELKRSCQRGQIKEPKKFKEVFECLWNKYSRIPTLHRLRYELLSPLVAYDLLRQAGVENEESLKNDIKKALNSNEYESSLEKLCGLCGKDDCSNLQNRFERLANQVKEKSKSSNDTFFSDLKSLADEIENMIAGVEAKTSMGG